MRILRSITIRKASSRTSLMSLCYKTISSCCSCAYVEILSTWEVWRALKRLELHSAAPRATLTPLSCSPNFPRAQYLDIRTLMHELIVNYVPFYWAHWIQTSPKRFSTKTHDINKPTSPPVVYLVPDIHWSSNKLNSQPELTALEFAHSRYDEYKHSNIRAKHTHTQQNKIKTNKQKHRKRMSRFTVTFFQRIF